MRYHVYQDVYVFTRATARPTYEPPQTITSAHPTDRRPHAVRSACMSGDEWVLGQLFGWQPIGRVLLQYGVQETAERGAHGLRVCDGVLYDHVNETVQRLGVERGLPHIQLVYYHTKRPEVSFDVVRLFLYEFRCHVEWGALDGVQAVGLVGEGPREPEVTHLDHTVGAHQDVLRLQVAVNDPVAVQIVQRRHQLGCYPTNLIFGQFLFVPKDIE
mmetsp:Transcript_12246/g.29326  ORF Transcript_12246/g.29326 Transcript_12246/m.29326 type:complete len:215 (-) Transcript_12246:354-998(-)